MKTNLTIYIDMDGVLANFSKAPNALERFEVEQGFFKKLQPIRSNVDYVKELVAKGHNVNILSASPNTQADNDKREWLAKWLPCIDNTHIILMRNGENKADYVRATGQVVLFDDYGKNCRDFEARGYMACKVKSYCTIRKLFEGLEG